MNKHANKETNEDWIYTIQNTAFYLTYIATEVKTLMKYKLTYMIIPNVIRYGLYVSYYWWLIVWL